MKHMMTVLGLGLIVFGILFLPLVLMGFIQFRQPYVMTQTPPSTESPLVIIHVDVLTMESEEVLTDQTVVIVDGEITTLALTDAVEFPANAQVIDGRGKYLMPGLVDMHVHIKDPNEMLLFLAAGVTSVRDMWGATGFKMRVMGAPDQLELRRQIEAGDLLGPTLYQAGPLMEGNPPTSPLMPVFRTPEQAEQSIRWQAEQGYDFVKVYDQLDPQTYQTILDHQFQSLP